MNQNEKIRLLTQIGALQAKLNQYERLEELLEKNFEQDQRLRTISGNAAECWDVAEITIFSDTKTGAGVKIPGGGGLTGYDVREALLSLLERKRDQFKKQMEQI